MATVVRSFAIQGIDGYPVDIEVKMLEGQPVISIIGLGDQAVKEAAERIQAAIDESGYVFPKKRVIISLAPSDKKKSGSHFDLAMAVGVLCQNGDIGVKKLPDYGFHWRIITGWKTKGMQGNPANDYSRAEKGNEENYCAGSKSQRGISGAWRRDIRVS